MGNNYLQKQKASGRTCCTCVVDRCRDTAVDEAATESLVSKNIIILMRQCIISSLLLYQKFPRRTHSHSQRTSRSTKRNGDRLNGLSALAPAKAPPSLLPPKSRHVPPSFSPHGLDGWFVSNSCVESAFSYFWQIVQCTRVMSAGARLVRTKRRVVTGLHTYSMRGGVRKNREANYVRKEIRTRYW